MNDFEEKYGTLIKWMLPQSNRDIKSVEFVEFKETSLVGYLTPVINVTVDKDSFSDGPFLKMALKGDVFIKMLDIHETYFPERKLKANIKFINLI